MKRLRKGRSIFLLLLIFSASIVAVIGMKYLSLVEYAGGWEVVTSMYGISIDHPDYGHYFITKRNISKFNYSEAGAKTWKNFDVDYRETGMPDITVTVTDPVHVGWDFLKSPDEQPLKTKSVRVGNSIYIFDLHRFVFTVQIRTNGYLELYYQDPFTKKWKYERSKCKLYTDFPAYAWTGTIYLYFRVKPWKIRSLGENYTLTGLWAGIMNAFVVPLSLEQGATVTDADVLSHLEVGYEVKNFPTEGSPLNLYYPLSLDKYEAPQWDAIKTPDPDIPSAVLISFSGTLDPGISIWRDIWGNPKDYKMVNVYAQFKIAVDVLTIHGFTLVTGEAPEDISVPNDTVTLGKEPNPWYVDTAQGLVKYFQSPQGQIMLFLIVISIFAIIIIFVMGKAGLFRALGVLVARASGRGGGGGGVQIVQNFYQGQPSPEREREGRRSTWKRKLIAIVLIGLLILLVYLRFFGGWQILQGEINNRLEPVMQFDMRTKFMIFLALIMFTILTMAILVKSKSKSRGRRKTAKGKKRKRR